MPAALNALAYMRGRFCWVIYDAGGEGHSPGRRITPSPAFPPCSSPVPLPQPAGHPPMGAFWPACVRIVVPQPDQHQPGLATGQRRVLAARDRNAEQPMFWCAACLAAGEMAPGQSPVSSSQAVLYDMVPDVPGTLQQFLSCKVILHAVVRAGA